MYYIDAFVGADTVSVHKTTMELYSHMELIKILSTEYIDEFNYIVSPMVIGGRGHDMINKTHTSDILVDTLESRLHRREI